MGVSITYDWFTNGFDAAPLDTARFQLKGVDVTLQSFIQNWSNPMDAIWNTPITSPCASDSDNPDRIIYVGVNFKYTTVTEWVQAYDAAIATFKTKYTHLKRVDLMTMLRAPNNVMCPSGNAAQVVNPIIDEAIAMEAQAHPTFVGIAPKIFVPDCSVFLPNSEHLQPGPSGVGRVAALIKSLYVNEP